jgi:hypothetical protein
LPTPPLPDKCAGLSIVFTARRPATASRRHHNRQLKREASGLGVRCVPGESLRELKNERLLYLIIRRRATAIRRMMRVVLSEHLLSKRAELET